MNPTSEIAGIIISDCCEDQVRGVEELLYEILGIAISREAAKSAKES
jgi:hypothetical protein